MVLNYDAILKRVEEWEKTGVAHNSRCPDVLELCIDVRDLVAQLRDEKYMYAGTRIKRYAIESRNNEIDALRKEVLDYKKMERERYRAEQAEAARVPVTVAAGVRPS